MAERNEKIRLLFERKVNDVSTSAAVAASNTCSSKDAKPKPPLIPPPQSSTVPTILAPMRKLQEPQPENNKHASSSSSLQPTPPLKSQQSSTFPAAKTASPPSKNIAIFNDLDDLDDDLNALESIDFLEDIISSQGSIQFSSGLSQASQERRRLVGAAIIDEDGDEDDIPVDELADSMQMVNIIDDDGKNVGG